MHRPPPRPHRLALPGRTRTEVRAVGGVRLVQLRSHRNGVEIWDSGTSDDSPAPDLEVCLVDVGPGPAAMVGALATAAPYAEVRGPGLQVVTEVATHGERVALVRAAETGPRLAYLRYRRAAFSVAEVLGVARTLASALALLHARDLVHGAVEEEVQVRPDGSVVLTGLGVAPLRGQFRAPADDVGALARLVLDLLDRADECGGGTGDPLAEPLRRAIDPALSGHPAARPTAAALAGALRVVGDGRPLALSPAETVVRQAVRPPVPPRRPPRWAVRRSAVLAGVSVVVVAAGVPLGLVESRRTPAVAAPSAVPSVAPAAPRSRPSPASTTSTAEWTAVLAGLARDRAAAYAHADRSLLRRVDAAGSAAEAIDVANVRAWQHSGRHLLGGVASLRVVAVRRAEASVAEIEIEERPGAYTVTGPGAAREDHPAGAARRWRVDLVRTAAGWRTAVVAAA